jgi:hypothetical protein
MGKMVKQRTNKTRNLCTMIRAFKLRKFLAFCFEQLFLKLFLKFRESLCFINSMEISAKKYELLWQRFFLKQDVNYSESEKQQILNLQQPLKKVQHRNIIFDIYLSALEISFSIK